MSLNYEQFGKYLLLEKVAAGGMAEIYLARSGAANGLNKFFAIKRILPQYSKNEDFVAMFKEEAKVAINLNHSNVVSIFDFGIENEQFFLVMDYVEGRNLRQIINELKKTNKSFSIDQALYLIKETAAGLDHAHRCTDSTSGRPLNITHRDMSPQNIMVSFEGEVKVIDFGIAKAETEAEDTKAGTLKGKFSYMSPEQAEGQPIDPRTDVFALGIVLWELLANDRLFTGSNEAAILRKVRDCQVPPIRKINPTVPQELERIVMKSLAKDRNVRYQTAANLHRDLNRFLNTQYPDFSPQDFSVFVKDCFKTAYQEGRDKLIKYSQINVAAPEPPIKLVDAPPPKGMVPPPPADKVAEPPPPEDLPQVPSGFNPEVNVKINLDSLKVSKGAPKAAPPPPGRSLNSTVAAGPAAAQTRVTQVTQATHSNHVGSSSRPKQSSTGIVEVLMKMALVGAMAYGGWWGYQNYYLPSTKVKPPIVKNPTPPVGTTEQASKVPDVKVSFSSNPNFAQIFVDGKDTQAHTPAVVSIPSNKEVEILIKKEGYLDYRVTRSFTDTSQVSATLQEAVSTAYLNINISDANAAFTKISINGKELLEKPPILKYPIVAQKETVITAYNPITKLSAEKRVTAKTGEEVDVQLVLDRQPANQK